MRAIGGGLKMEDRKMQDQLLEWKIELSVEQCRIRLLTFFKI